jgi:hypothetical protein
MSELTAAMRTKPATLATAGKRLNGPPEGYGRKKELQVKHWLVGSAQQTSDAADAAANGAQEIIAEVSACTQQLYYNPLQVRMNKLNTQRAALLLLPASNDCAT